MFAPLTGILCHLERAQNRLKGAYIRAVFLLVFVLAFVFVFTFAFAFVFVFTFVFVFVQGFPKKM